jgi:hypothetical protein
VPYSAATSYAGVLLYVCVVCDKEVIEALRVSHNHWLFLDVNVAQTTFASRVTGNELSTTKTDKHRIAFVRT